MKMREDRSTSILSEVSRSGIFSYGWVIESPLIR